MNVVGGVRVDEPGCDLAVALAVASASRGVPLRGSLRGRASASSGLTGELRWVGHPERRLQEAAKHGCERRDRAARTAARQACEAATLREALAAALPRGARPRAPPRAASGAERAAAAERVAGR